MRAEELRRGVGMNFPSQSEEDAWHERLLSGDPVVSTEVFEAFVEPILEALGGSRMASLQRDEAYDSIVDVILSYVNDPQRFIPGRGRLRDYLIGAARNKLADRHRSREARRNREEKYMEVVEVWAPSPKDVMERAVLAREVMDILRKDKLTQKDLTLLELYLESEGSTRVVGEALGLPPMPEAELRAAVKRHWDRLKKSLARTGEELADADA
jgi:RNA polymerase sigma-70 factor (ECF subfamily)